MLGNLENSSNTRESGEFLYFLKESEGIYFSSTGNFSNSQLFRKFPKFPEVWGILQISGNFSLAVYPKNILSAEQAENYSWGPLRTFYIKYSLLQIHRIDLYAYDQCRYLFIILTLFNLPFYIDKISIKKKRKKYNYIYMKDLTGSLLSYLE